MRSVTIEGFLDSADVIHADACWPAPDWPGWVQYDAAYECKRASDRATPLPPFLSCLLARMAQAQLGAMLGMGESVPDLSLHGGGLHEMPAGAGLGRHLDADVHPRLGLERAWSAVLYVHAFWDESWGGALHIEMPGHTHEIAPRPGRLVVFDCREQEHSVAPVRCPAGCSRRSLALFGYLPRPGRGTRPRAVFADRRAKDR